MDKEYNFEKDIQQYLTIELPAVPTELLDKMIAKYGIDEQMRQLMGECGELIAVLQNYYRATKYSFRKETLEDVMKEVIDVYFMLLQIRQLDPKLFDYLFTVQIFKVKRKLELEDKT